MKPVVLSVSQWQRIRAELHTEHPKSVFMLKDKMRAVLGFTVREHSEWVEFNSTTPASPSWLETGQEGFYKNKHH